MKSYQVSGQAGRVRIKRLRQGLKLRQTIQSLTILFLLLTSSVLYLHGATLPAGFSETLVASGLINPTAMAFAPDGRLFVCQQGGQLRVIKNGALLSTPFLTVNTDQNGERGLLGIAFDPNFASNHFIYIYYTVPVAPVHNRVSRFTANGDVAVAGSEVVILELNNLSSATNHNGGSLHFGEDGKLYIAVGENANSTNSQSFSNLLGKMLRINSDGTIPTDNPFFNTTTGNNRAIWALGLRNPYTFAFQPVTRRMFINDVGQNVWEEIDDGIAGSNYGWPACEGSCSNAGFRNPLFQYAHGSSSTTGCAITGGTFYNPPVNQFPSNYVGKYFFADFCSGWIRLFDPSNNTASDFASGISSPVDLQVGADGCLYYLARGSGAVFKIQSTTGQPPSITSHPSSQTIIEGQPVTFSVVATGSPTLSYQWQRNGFNIPGANSSSYTIPSVSVTDNGAKFRVVVSNAAGSATSNEATLAVTPTPKLLLEENSGRGIALDSVTWMRVFSIVDTTNFSPDQRLRLTLLATDVGASDVVTAQAEDAQHNIHPLAVEYVGKVPGFDWLTQIIVKPPDTLINGGDVLISINAHGVNSNKVLVSIKP